MDQLEHAYAITVHKSQGSEFDVVILVASQSAPMLLTRNLIYTAMTRAKTINCNRFSKCCKLYDTK